TRPLQSKPLGSLPPLRYGTPRRSSAVASASAPGEDSAILGGRAGGRVAGVLAPGKGLGTAPPEAHPAAISATSTAPALRVLITGVRNIDVNHCVAGGYGNPPA